MTVVCLRGLSIVQRWGITLSLNQAFAAARVNQELAKEGIPLPFGNKIWASNWPTGKSPLLGLVIHMIPSVRISLGTLPTFSN